MQATAPIGCFFIDASVILSEILRENTPRLEKFKKDISFHKVPCFFTDSVKHECDKKIEETLNFLGNVIRQSISLALEESRKNKKIPLESSMTPEDIVALEELFSILHGATRATLQLTSPTQIVEEWAITFLGEKLEQGTKIEISQFLIELTKRLLSLAGSIQDPYDELVTFERSFARKKVVVVDASIVDSLRKLDVHDPDATHVACAICHKMKNGQESVFVTFDYSSILSKKHNIKKAFNQLCSDPLYAIYHLIP